jgi:hypothetical protein
VVYGQVDTKQPQGRLRPNRSIPWPPHHPTDRANAPHPVSTRKVAPAPVVWARPTKPQQTSVQPVCQTLRRVHLAQKLLAGDTPDAVDAQALCAAIQQDRLAFGVIADKAS